MEHFTGYQKSEAELLVERIRKEEFLVISAACAAASNAPSYFNGDELLNEDQNLVSNEEGVRDQLILLQRTPSYFRIITNFSAEEFEELSQSVCPLIATMARSTGQPRSLFHGRQPKLSPQQRLLLFILYMKHDNTVRMDAFTWNWSKSSTCDDTLFVASCINEALAEELQWPNSGQRRALGSMIPDLEGCIGFIDGTLIRIRRPSNVERHQLWYNGRKSMYALNNTVVIDHRGLFIYIDPGYPGSFHDVNCLRQSDLYKNWRRHFTHRDEYFEYLLGDPGYVGEEMFIMRRIGRREVPDEENLEVVDAFNAMHAGFRVRVEWGIGGLKRKWRRLMKTFESSREKFPHLFRSAAILTNFLQRRRLDMSSDMEVARQNAGWEGDF